MLMMMMLILLLLLLPMLMLMLEQIEIIGRLQSKRSRSPAPRWYS